MYMIYHINYKVVICKFVFFLAFIPYQNLIVIIFNLVYHVFIVGFDYKGCVLERERECEDSSKWRQKTSRGCLATKFPAKWSMCLAHDWNAKSLYRWRQLCLASISQIRPSCETFCSASLYCLIHTFCTLTIYTYITHKCERELLRENPS